MTKMTAEQIIKSMKDMENGERIKFLEYLYHAHFNSGLPIEDITLAVRNHIEDYIDRDLTEEETTIMKLAYDKGYWGGFNIGMQKALKSED